MAQITSVGLRRCVSFSDKENLPAIYHPRKRSSSLKQLDLDQADDKTYQLITSLKKLHIEGRVVSPYRKPVVSTIERLPEELLYLVFLKLNIKDTINFGSCSKTLLSYLPVALRIHANRIQSSYVSAIPLAIQSEHPEVVQLFTRKAFCLVQSPHLSSLELKRCFKKWLMTLLKVLHATPALNNRDALYTVLMQRVFVQDGLPTEFFLKFLETGDGALKRMVLKFLLNKCVQEHDLVCLNKIERIAGNFLTTSQKIFFKEGRFNICLDLNKIEEAAAVLSEISELEIRDYLIHEFGRKCLVLDQLECFFWAMSEAQLSSTKYLLLINIYTFCRKMLAAGQPGKVFLVVSRLSDSIRKRMLITELMDVYIKNEDTEGILSLIDKLSDHAEVENAAYKLVNICIKKRFLERGEALINQFLSKRSCKNTLLYDLCLAYFEKGDLDAVLRLIPQFTEGYGGKNVILRHVSHRYLESVANVSL